MGVKMTQLVRIYGLKVAFLKKKTGNWILQPGQKPYLKFFRLVTFSSIASSHSLLATMVVPFWEAHG